MLSVAENSLTAVKNKVVELRGIIASANTPNGGTLTELDNLYKNGLQEAQRLLDQAVFDNRVLFNAVTVLNVRVGEKITDTIAVALNDLTANTLNFRHAVDVQAARVGDLANANPSGGFIGGIGVAPAAGANGNNAAVALFNAGIAIVGAAAASGLMADGANNIVGSIQNTVLATVVGAANTAPGILGLANTLVRTAQQNQVVADNIMKAMETLLTSNLNNVVGQKESLRSAAENLDDLITVVNSGADSYLLTEYEDSSKRFQAELLSLQGAISTIAQGARVASATLDLIKGQ